MAKLAAHKRKLANKSTNPERFVKLEYYLLNSGALNDLSLAARWLYVEIKKRYNGTNNGYLSFAVREAATILKVGKGTAQQAFVELECHGFIRARQKGSFHLKKRHATEWILTEYDFPEGAAPTKDFMRWKSDAIKSPSQGAKKQKPVPEGGTDSTSQRDQNLATVPLAGTDGTSDRDRAGQKRSPHGTSERDTSNIPCSGTDQTPIQTKKNSATAANNTGDPVMPPIPDFLDRKKNKSKWSSKTGHRAT
jgi:hypothetical protein